MDSRFDETFTKTQYHLIRLFKRLVVYYEGKQAPWTLLDLTCEIFEGTENIPGGRNMMVQKLKIASPGFATRESFKKAIKTDDIVRAKILIDYFGFNNFYSHWEKLRRKVKTETLPRLSQFYNNSLELLELQKGPPEDFIAFYEQNRDVLSLNIVAHDEELPLKERFILNNKIAFDDCYAKIYDFVLQQGSEFDIDAQFHWRFQFLNRLYLAVQFNDEDDGSFKRAEKLLQYPQVDVNDEIGAYTPLIWVIKDKQSAAAEFLLQQKILMST